MRNVFVKGSFHGGLVEIGKHTALKMRSRKASGFESLALYQNRDIPVKTCRCGGIGRHRRVMRFGERRSISKPIRVK